MQEVIKNRAASLLTSGTVSRVMGWKEGEFFYDNTPFVFTSPEEIEKDFVYNSFCGQNFSKALVKESGAEGKIAVFLKPCDTYSFNQLINEHRLVRENIYVVGIPCDGMCDIEKVKDSGIKGILTVKEEKDELSFDTLYGDKKIAKKDALLERCTVCKGKKHFVYDELIGEEGEILDSKRFDQVEMLEKMTAEERYAFWQKELSKCIRCNACRNACPACTCEKCVFDNDNSGIANKAPSDEFEEKLFHIIRAFHVAGRCTDCGECSRVCPQNIPLHLLNRKFIKDINELYGEYQAGEKDDTRSPLTSFEKEDCEPNIVYQRGEQL